MEKTQERRNLKNLMEKFSNSKKNSSYSDFIFHSIYILGKPGSGKNYLLTQLMGDDFFYSYTFLVIIAPNFRSKKNEFFRNWAFNQKYIKRKNIFIFRTLGEKTLTLIQKLKRAVIIIDDMIIVHSKIGREITKLLIDIRHRNLFIAVLSQNVKYLTPDMKEFFDIVVHFNIKTKDNLKKFFDLFLAGDMEIEEFKELNKSLKNYDIHVIYYMLGEREIIRRKRDKGRKNFKPIKGPKETPNKTPKKSGQKREKIEEKKSIIIDLTKYQGAKDFLNTRYSKIFKSPFYEVKEGEKIVYLTNENIDLNKIKEKIKDFIGLKEQENTKNGPIIIYHL